MASGSCPRRGAPYCFTPDKKARDAKRPGVDRVWWVLDPKGKPTRE